MSVTAAIRRMLSEGLTLEQALIAAEAFEAALQPKLTARQERNRRYYEARKEQGERLKASEKRLNKTEPEASEKRLKASESVLNSDALARVVVSSLPSLHSEEVITPISPDGEMPPRKENPGFARFWSAYPNKTGKGAAEKSFSRAVRIIGGPDPPGVLIAAIERAKLGRQWQGGFIPNPATWLNQRRWEDQIEPPRTNVHELPTPDPKRLAREANHARAFAGSEMAFGRRT